MAKRYYDNDDYAGIGARKATEATDSRMISEDRTSIANLPQDVMIKAYPKRDYMGYDLDDTISTVDTQMNDDVRGGKNKGKEKYPTKY